MKKETLVVIISSFAVSVEIITRLFKISRFTVLKSHGIISWVTENRYPIQAQLYYYLFAFVLSITVALLFYLLWRLTSAAFSKIYDIPLRRAAVLDCYTYLFGVAGLLMFFIDKKFFLESLPFFITGIFLSKPIIVPFAEIMRKRATIKRIADASFAVLSRIVGPVSLPRDEKITPLGKVLVYFVIPVAIYLIFYNPNMVGAIDFYHEGEMLAPLQGVLNGGLPYKDFYIMHGIAHNVWMPWIGMKLFGPTIEGVRRLYSYTQGGLIPPLAYMALYSLCLAIFRKRVYVFLAILFLACAGGISSLGGRHIFPLLSLYFVASFINSQKRWKLFFAGAAVATSIMFSTEMGLLSLASVTIFLFLYFFVLNHKNAGERAWSRVFFYAAGFISGITPLMIYLVVTGSMPAYINFLLSDSLKLRLLIFGLPMGEYHEAKYFPIVVYMIGSLWVTCEALFGAFTKTTAKCLLLLIAGTFYFIPALIRSDGAHIAFSGFLAYVITFIPLESFVLYARGIFVFKKRALWRRDFIYIAIAASCVILVSAWAIGKFSPKHLLKKLAAKTRYSFSAPRGYVHPGFNRAGDIYIPKEQADSAAKILNCIRNIGKDGDYIYDFSNAGAYYFLSDRRIPVKYIYVAYSNTPEEQAQVVRDLERHRPRCVIFEDSIFDGIKYTERYPIIWGYIEKRYSAVLKEKDIHIMYANKDVS